MSVWIAPLVAGIATAIILALLLQRTTLLPLDHPNERSLHSQPTPRIGGLALLPGATLGWVAASGSSFDARVLLGLAGILFALSLADDLKGLPVVLRLGAHLIVALCLSLWLLGPSPLAVMAALAVAWMTNLYNFMDGANGLAGGMTAIGFAGFGFAVGDSSLSFALAGAALGFLFFNFDPSRVFLGDAGSIPLGFLAGGVGLLGVVRGEWPWWFPLLVFSVFAVDASLTLARRLMRQEKVWNAHRDHYYQRLVRMGCSHRRLALFAYVLMTGSAASAVLLLHVEASIQLLGLVAWVLIYAALSGSIDRRWSSYQSQTQLGESA